MKSKLIAYWKGKAVLVTGASSGLGYALVEALAPYGIQFCLLSRRQEPMEGLAKKLATSGSQFWIRACDVQKREEVETAIADFVKTAGRLDVAWVNSGIGGDTSFKRWDWDFVERMLDTNLKGAIYTAHTCLTFMVRQNHGAIIAISSAAAMRGLAGRSIYSVTKIGLAYYMEAMAAELPHIQFTTIYPGFVDTPINRGNPNRFWLMTAEHAAQLMIKAVAKRKQEYIYPFRMKLLFHLVRALPASLYRWLGQRMIELSRPR
ncbi:MAG: SDR family NAD(P)-dependent oxidoreductase [candidate division KSB1 bacterium]|nr:SDR family NAD(P)-dependent oxidoreductase [candidate division KSB1 bacterium]